MTHEEISGMYELYALGVLEPEEREEIESHLARECPECRAELCWRGRAGQPAASELRGAIGRPLVALDDLVPRVRGAVNRREQGPGPYRLVIEDVDLEAPEEDDAAR